MQTEIYIEKRHVSEYPLNTECYAPSQEYPEHPAMETQDTHNDAYDMVRSALHGFGMDSEHFGSERWNPLGTLIQHDNCVLIKPSWVFHKNHQEQNGTDCLVTHTSILRAVLDYTVIALGGTGRIIVADAPIQSCDFETLRKDLNLDALMRFYKDQGINIEFLDLRNLHESQTPQAKNGYQVVDLAENSAFSGFEEGTNRYRITSYNPLDMSEYHRREKHAYCISECVLMADVIINLPKPKCHRKSGATISLKNLVGCIARKECLPHHIVGSAEEGGDAYLYTSLLKKAREKFLDYQNKHYVNQQVPKYVIFMLSILQMLGKLFGKDAFFEGSWYGNDTLWRMICDINRIILYANKEGCLCDQAQRKIFTLADMIISGESEGPLMPSPKKVGAIVCGFHGIAFDKAVAAVMGFDYQKIPSISKAGYGIKYRLPNDSPLIWSNDPTLHLKSLREIANTCSHFQPSTGWQNYIEWKDEERIGE